LDRTVSYKSEGGIFPNNGCGGRPAGYVTAEEIG